MCLRLSRFMKIESVGTHSTRKGRGSLPGKIAQRSGDGACTATTDSKPDRALGLHCRLVDQHDRNIVPDRVDAMAFVTLQALGILAVFKRLFAGGANQDFEQILGDHAEHCTTTIRCHLVPCR